MTMNQGFIAGIAKDILKLGERIAELEHQNNELRAEMAFKDGAIASLREDRKELWQFVKPVEGAIVSYVGVYTTRWRDEWGEPTAGFVRAAPEDDEE